MSNLQLSRSGYLPGAAAGLLAVAVMLALGRLWGAPAPPQMLADRITATIPLEVFARLLGQLEASAKPLTFALLVGGQVLLGGLLGAWLDARLRAGADPVRAFAAVAVGVWLLLALVIAPLGGVGVAGAASSAGLWTTSAAFAVTAVAFSALLTLWLASAAGRFATDLDPSRRRALVAALVGVPAVLAAAYLGRFFTTLAQRSQVSGRPGGDGLPPALTPVEDFYVVSKNFVDPNVSLASWELTVAGLVERPRIFQYGELREMPAVTQITTLECISNEVGGHYISNGQWTGVRLADVLEQVGVPPGAVDVVLTAADDYDDSIPLEAAMDPRTILAYDMNGAPLTIDHGFPLRLVVPGIYGMKNVKWIHGIAVVDHDVQGYWQRRGWSDVATVEPMSRIDTPRMHYRFTVGAEVLVGGIAYTGVRGVSGVEISFDRGESWLAADVEPPLSPMSWVRWTRHWRPNTAGSYEIAVRCITGDGEVQTDEERAPLPDGSTGHHKIIVRVIEAGG